MTAMMENLRLRLPQVHLVLFSLNPLETAERYGLPTFPIRRAPPLGFGVEPPPPSGPNPAWRERLKAIPWIRATFRVGRDLVGGFAQLPAELRFLWVSYRRLRAVDLLLVTGSGQLNDSDGGPWAYPYTLAKWAFLARLAGVPLVFASVGAGTVTTPLGRLFLRSALRSAEYHSCRDDWTARVVGSLRVRGPHPVTADLAFSLPVPPARPPAQSRRATVVGVNPLPYFDASYWPIADPARYEPYVQALAAFCAALLDAGYNVTLFSTQIRADPPVAADVERRIGPDTGRTGRLSNIHPKTVSELFTAVAQMDFVVPTRFHGIVFAGLLGKPILCLSYEPKSRAVMETLSQGRHVMEVESISSQALRDAFDDLVANRATVSATLAARVPVLVGQLQRQYDLIVDYATKAQPTLIQRTSAP